MSRPAATLSWTTEDFLAWEREQPERYEWDGYEAIAMTGARLRHNLVINNLSRALFAVVPSGCRVFTENVKLRAGDAIRYPDVLINCTPNVDLNADDVDDATLTVEVLSPSSLHTDRVKKVADYGRVPGLEAYLIVDPGQRNITLYRRDTGQLALVAPTELTGENVRLFGEVFVRLDDVYAGVLEGD